MFRLYAVPWAADGRYRFCGEQHLYIKTFPALDAMMNYWQDVVLPNSSTTFGLKYELSMVEIEGIQWDFIGDPRYADTPVLQGEKIPGCFVVNC